MSTNAILITIVTVLAFAYAYLKKKYSYWKNRDVLSEEPVFPWGNIKGIGTKRHAANITHDLYMKFRGKDVMAGMYFFTQPVALLLDPELIKSVLVRDFNKFHDRGFYYNEKHDPLSAHLFSIEGQQWKTLRAKLTPTFTSGKMKSMFTTVIDVANKMVDSVKELADNRQDFEIKDLVSRYTTDVIGSTAFGIDCNSLENPEAEFRENGKLVFDPPPAQQISLFFGNVFPKFARLLHLKLFPVSVTKFFTNVVHQTVIYRKSQNVQRKDFMQLLIDIETAEGKNTIDQMNMKDVAANAFLFFLAGFETSSTTMSFCFYELAKNVDIQNRLREEIEEVLERHDGKVTYESLLEMPFLEMCINETFRMYPSVENLFRLAISDYQVPGTKHVIEKGTLVIVPVYGMHKDPKIHNNPDQFDPERFSEENVKTRHPFTHLPFGEGPRNCIGMRFGLMQTRLGLVTLLRKYKFSLAKDTPTKVTLNPRTLVLAPHVPLKLVAQHL